jgi:pantoate--beta-alanine ligase
MKVLSTVAEMRDVRRKLFGSVGLVPTMGYLHQGHLALVRRALNENHAVVVSLFVNPTQFGVGEDFKKYPRDTERDLTLLEREGAGIVFMPSVEEMYPQGCSTFVDMGGVAERLEGASRPGHFRGVATVVTKLFNIVEPNKAYFGQKDAQQAVVIKRMIADLNVNLEVVVVPTAREPDGLAMSSRNTYLNTEERQAALALWQSLTLARQLWTRGEHNAENIRREMRALIEKEPLADIDYISIADPDTLEELVELGGPALVSLAVHIGKTRLIDNITLGVDIK